MMSSFAKQYGIPDVRPASGDLNLSGEYIKFLSQIGPTPLDATEYLQHDEIPLVGETVSGAVMFIDIGSFTARSGQLTPAQTAYWVNRFFEQLWPLCENERATLDKTIGDCLMLLLSPKLGCRTPVQSALRIAFEALKWDVYGYYPHLGIAEGDFWLGYAGPSEALNISAYGDVVNLASRLAAASARSIALAIPVDLWSRCSSAFPLSDTFEAVSGTPKLPDFQNIDYIIVSSKTEWNPQFHLPPLGGD